MKTLAWPTSDVTSPTRSACDLEVKCAALREVVLGDPFTEQLLGPSSLAWGRKDEEQGRVACVTTDGGFLVTAPDGVVRPAALLRLSINGRKARSPEIGFQTA